MENIQFDYDIVIVGGGVIGCSVARYLSQYTASIAVIEAGNDFSVGTSKANSGIVHAGHDAANGSNKAKYNVLGNRMMQELCRELQVPFGKNGAYVLAFGAADELKPLLERGQKNGVNVSIVSGDFVRQNEPNVSANVTAALYAPDSGIVSPYELCIALGENAIANGASVFFNTAVTGIKPLKSGYEVAVSALQKTPIALSYTQKNTIKCRAVVNAAGLKSDEINNYVCDKKYSIIARRGEYCLLDKTAYKTSATLFQLPNKFGKGVLVAPTCHGNTLVGPTAHDIDDKTDISTTYDGLNEAFEKAQLSVPSISKREIITQFAGLRSKLKNSDDFIVEESREGFFNAVGIDSPGLASSPAIGLEIAQMAAKRLGLKENSLFNPNRAAIPTFATATDETRAKLIKQNPLYGRIICRCETVTEGEIVEAIKRGARDTDGIKRRVRAGMGRCQAGFCTPNLLKILSRELNIDMELVTKDGAESEYLLKGEDCD